MNKAGLILTVFSVLFAVLILSSGVMAKDVAYVLKNTAYPVSNFVSSMDELNLTYDLIAANMVSITNFSKYRMILVGDEYISNLQVNSYKTLFVSPTYYSGWSSMTGSSAGNQPLIANNTATSAINKDLMGLFQVYSSCCDSHGISLPMYYLGGIKYGANRITATKSNLGEYVIATKDNPRREFFGATEADYWTGTTKQMFENSLSWILIGDDKDGDGFFSDADCNDTNNLINPNGTEIAYNHIDENCDGADLADVDNDGYCQLGYAITNKALQCANETTSVGTDCNDDDNLIYPGAFEAGDGIDTNCMAEAPIFTGHLDNITWDENEQGPSINLSDYFHDADGRAIDYFVSTSSPVNQTHTIINGSIVTFSSDKYWYGEDWVIFGARNSAGIRSYANKMFMIINSINNAPILDNVTDLYYVAGDLINVNISAFDPDVNETLTYSLSGDVADKFTGENPWEWETTLGDAGDYNITVGVSDGNFSDSREIAIHILPKIIINEFETSGGWIELFNPSENDVNITGWTLGDKVGTMITLDETTIMAGGYYVVDANLDGRGDFVTLISNGTVIDKTPTLTDNFGDDRTWQRVPNGLDTGTLADWTLQKATPGLINDADVSAPIVNLIGPLAHETVTDSNIEFGYSVWDDKALELNCSLYVYENTAYQAVDSQIVENGTDSSFSFSLENNNYLWMIGCDDGKNTGYSEIRSLIVNAPQPPVINNIINGITSEGQNSTIIIYATDPNAQDTLTYSIDDPRFDVSMDFTGGHKFLWQTGYDDAGTYDVNVTVSDGVFNVTENLSVTIRNTNRAPVVEEIENQTLLEDTSGTFMVNATDPDGDSLTYRAMSNASEITCSVTGDIVTMNPAANWNGLTSCTIKVSDGNKEVDKIVGINVTPVNDAPVFGTMTGILVNATQTAVIVVNASDIENDALTYWTNDSRFIQDASSNNTFTWQTNYSDAGVYFIELGVSDGQLNTTLTLQVTVDRINEPPHWLPIPDFQIYEDSGENLLIENISSYAYDNDGNITRFSVFGDVNQVACKIVDNNLIATPAKDFATNNFTGMDDLPASQCVIKAVDNSGDGTNVTIRINVSNINDAPVIDTASPANNPKIAEDAFQLFSINWHDIDTNRSLINSTWFVNGNEVHRGDSYMFSANNSLGIFDVGVVLDDGDKQTEKDWNITTSNIPLTDVFNGATTNFTGMNDSQLTNSGLVLERLGMGKIEFLDKVDLRNVVDLDSYTDIENGLAGIDSSAFTTLKNKRATISLYNLNFAKVPTIYYNSRFTRNLDSITQICPSSICSNVSYANGLLTFQTSSFSIFKVGDTRTCASQRGFVCGVGERCTAGFMDARDTNLCCMAACIPSFKASEICNQSNDNIEIDLKNPNEDDSFKVGDTINGDFKISSSLDVSKNFDYIVSLYDFSSRSDVATADGSVKINSGSSKDVSFKLEIPSDADENDEYYVHVKVKEGNNKTSCNENYVKVNIDRNNQDVVIDTFSIDSETAVCGDTLELKADVSNIGSMDENGYIIFGNDALNISQQSDTFKLESFGGNDKASRTMSVKIPENASAGDYVIRASAVFGSVENSAEKTITLGECVRQGSNVENVSPNTITDLGGSAVEKISSGFSGLVIVSVTILAILLIVLLILIVAVGRRRANIKEE